MNVPQNVPEPSRRRPPPDWETYIAALLERFPPLTEEQLERIAALLRKEMDRSR